MPRPSSSPSESPARSRKFLLDTICRADAELLRVLVEEVQSFERARARRTDPRRFNQDTGTRPGDTLPGPLPGPIDDYVPADHAAYEEYLRTRPFGSVHFTFSGWLRNRATLAARPAEPQTGSTKKPYRVQSEIQRAISRSKQ